VRRSARSDTSGVDIRTAERIVISEDPGTVPASANGRGYAVGGRLLCAPVDEFRSLNDEEPAGAASDRFPFVLSAGERRSSTANDVVRDADWRKKDKDGSLRISPDDATALGVVDGDRIRIVSKRGEAEAPAEVTDTVMAGHVTLPHGFGTEYPDEDGKHKIHGVAVNELTDIEDRDWLSLTPHHKHVRVALEPVAD